MSNLPNVLKRTQPQSVAMLLLCGLLLTGCRERTHDATTEPADKHSATQPIPHTHYSTAPVESEPELQPAHLSAIRLQPLPVDQFPHVVPDNGARHGFATILESLGSGAAAIDYDRDGWPDAVIAGGGDFDGRTCIGKPVHLLRNRKTQFVNATSTSGIGTTRFYHHGICAADFNNDGFQDFLVTGYSGVQLFCNLGDGTFAESLDTVDLFSGGWSASAAWGDFNHDGHLDVYITSYVNWSFDNDPPCFASDQITRDNCSPKIFEALPDRLLISNGNGTFTEQSTSFNVRPDGKALGAVAADLNSDGYLDLYVGNDVMMNFLYRNEAGKSFTDWSIFGGAAGSRRGSPDASMGVDIVDFNNDGIFDIWAANFEMESFALYRGLGDLQFRHVSETTGVSAIGGQYVGWGTAFVDLDLDGDSDCIVCNGNVVQHPQHSPTLQRMVILESIGGQYFEAVTRQTGSAPMTPMHGRGLALTDWNRDGRVDLLITPTHAPSQLLQNESVTDGRSLTVELCGRTSPRQAVGAIVTLTTSSVEDGLKRTQTKQLVGGGSYASTSLAELNFGFKRGEEVQTLQVQWPGGQLQTVSFKPESRFVFIIESAAAYESMNVDP